jgi:hypothetical protein
MKFPAKKDYRKKIKRENDLLTSRTSFFLITSGLLLIAFGIADDAMVRLLLSILGLVFTVSWAVTSWQNGRVIRDLTMDYRKMHRSNYLEEIVQNAMFKPGWRRPAFLIAKVLPITFVLTWFLLLLLHILKLLRLLILF